MPANDTSWADKYGGVTPYYPQQRYIDKNLAPEKGLPNMHLEALAAANQEALRNNLMSPKLASKMLPTILTEGAMGINRWGYPDVPKYRAILEKAGLPPTIKEVSDLRKNATTAFDKELINAKLIHALMAVKADIYGEEKATERWNGKGKTDSYSRPADAAHHAYKVSEAERLLAHPKNKPMADYWADMQARYANGAPPQVSSLPPASTWADKNVPGLFAPPVNALLEYATETKNALANGQRAIRNWTAY